MFIRADIQSARALTNLNNLLTDAAPIIVQKLFDLVDLLAKAFPDAEKAVVEERKAMMATKVNEKVNVDEGLILKEDTQENVISFPDSQ